MTAVVGPDRRDRRDPPGRAPAAPGRNPAAPCPGGAVSAACSCARIVRPLARELVVRGGHRAAEQCLMARCHRCLAAVATPHRRQDHALAAAGRWIINLQSPPPRPRPNPTSIRREPSDDAASCLREARCGARHCDGDDGWMAGWSRRCAASTGLPARATAANMQKSNHPAVRTSVHERRAQLLAPPPQASTAERNPTQRRPPRRSFALAIPPANRPRVEGRTYPDSSRYDAPRTIRHDAIRYDTIRYDTIRYDTIRHE